MPRHAHHVPKYRRRPGRTFPSGRREPDQAVVTIGGVDHYLGPYNTTASKHLYDRLIAEWLAAGRAPAPQAARAITVAELCAGYWKYAKAHYVKHGRSTNVTLGFPPETAPVVMRESHPGVARKGFSIDEEDQAHDGPDHREAPSSGRSPRQGPEGP